MRKTRGASTVGVPPPSVLKMKINTVPQAAAAAVVTLLTAYCCFCCLDITVLLLPHESVQTVISYIREYSHDDDGGVFFFFRLFNPNQTTRSWRITFYSHLQPRSGLACWGLLRDRYKESAHGTIATHCCCNCRYVGNCQARGNIGSFGVT